MSRAVERSRSSASEQRLGDNPLVDGLPADAEFLDRLDGFDCAFSFVGDGRPWWMHEGSPCVSCGEYGECSCAELRERERRACQAEGMEYVDVDGAAELLIDSAVAAMAREGGL